MTGYRIISIVGVRLNCPYRGVRPAKPRSPGYSLVVHGEFQNVIGSTHELYSEHIPVAFGICDTSLKVRDATPKVRLVCAVN